MKAAVMYGPRDIRIEEVPHPIPGKGEVTVQIKATGICGSDIHFFDGTHPYKSYPRVHGHEMAGVINEISNDVQNLKKGDRVVIEPLTACGKCYPCRIGKYNCCTNLKFVGAFGVYTNGGFAEYVTVPARQIYKIPDSLPFDVASLCEPFAIGSQCIKRVDMKPDDNVAILGAGVIGQTILYFAKHLGAKALVTDISDFRLNIAKNFRADIIVNPQKMNVKDSVMQFTNNEGASVVIEATGVSKVMENTEDLVASGGRIGIVGLTNEKVCFNGINFTRKEITIVGSRNSANMFPHVINSISSDRDHVQQIITRRFSFKKIIEAFDYASKNLNNIGKIVITFD